LKFEFASHYRYWELCIAALKETTDAGRAEVWKHWDFAADGDPKMNGKVQCGYYKRRVGGRWAILHIDRAQRYDERSDGALAWRRDNQMSWNKIEDGDAFSTVTWHYIEPISFETYDYAFKHGRLPGEVDAPLPSPDHNMSDPGADYRDQMIDLIGRIETYVGTLAPGVISEDEANALANYLDMLRLAEKSAAELCSAEIESAKAKIAERKGLWATPIAACAELAGKIKDLITPFLKQAKAEGRPAKLGGQRGNRVGLRPVWKAKVTDWALVYPEFSEHPTVRAEILRILHANARSKERWTLIVPGAQYYEDEHAA
jgi:hypothetical protein